MQAGRPRAHAAALPDGPYIVAVRPHHVTAPARAEAAVPLEGKVLITELSGSESIAHFEFGDQTWVSQSHGVHPYRIGDARIPSTSTRRGCLYFDPDGPLVAA